jgi:hypothetical protein
VRVSLLVPYRAEPDSIRAKSWEWLRRRWTALVPSWEIVEGTDHGEPFSKTVAVNDAYSRAGGDVFVIADADSWMNICALNHAISDAAFAGVLVVPWTTAHRLRRIDSEDILRMNPATPNPVADEMKRLVKEYRPAPSTGAMIVCISRAGFERVGGMDPRFRGWGAEDVSFALACNAILGPTVNLRHEAYALHHPRLRQQGRPVWENDTGTHNKPLGSRYWQARGNREQMMALCAEHPLRAVESVG